MLLKVGELAKRSGLTVRTLHHYDDIGLLKPSARSASGYRLYNKSDIERLHAIQALRGLGFALADIENMLAATDTSSLPNIIDRQLQALHQEIVKANELHGRLSMLREQLSNKGEPDMSDWLSTLELMATYSRHFTAAELKSITASWKQLEEEWQALIKDISVAMETQVRPTDVAAQSLARRWMNLSVQWMHGDFGLLQRWRDMCMQEPRAHGASGINHNLFVYIQAAIEPRVAALNKYLNDDELKRLKHIPEHEWEELEKAVIELMRDKVPTESQAARTLAAQWTDLIDRIADRDPAIRAKLGIAIRNEPLLQSSAPLSALVRDFLRRASAPNFL